MVAGGDRRSRSQVAIASHGRLLQSLVANTSRDCLSRSQVTCNGKWEVAIVDRGCQHQNASSPNSVNVPTIHVKYEMGLKLTLAKSMRYWQPGRLFLALWSCSSCFDVTAVHSVICM